MADWRHIQARIRKAKASSNPAENLTELHQRTRDAMVAFELARLHEKNGDSAEAAKWYTTAAQQFRRAQWRVKAEEALTRLGAEIPPQAVAADRTAAIEESAAAGPAEEEQPASPAEARGLPEEQGDTVEEFEQIRDGIESTAAPGTPEVPEAPAPGAARKRHRRGRRGGRKHRRTSASPEPAGSERDTTRPVPPAATRASTIRAASAAPSSSPVRSGAGAYRFVPAAEAEPNVPIEPIAEPAHEQRAESAGAIAGRTRGAEPALSSRLSQLESRLRRLLACPLSELGDAEQAPAGPGVLLLSDSDQVTHYYVEACHTLRIGIGNLSRGGRGSKDSGRIKQVMAENLGITESRVSKYMNDHCVVRWLQLDEGAPELAHFAIALLRPVVNE